MSSAAEARFRVQAPNSKPRSIKVIALDEASERVVRRLAEGSWTHATFLTAAAFAGASRRDTRTAALRPVDPTQDRPEPSRGAVDGWLTDITGGTRSLKDEVDAADLVVMVATPGGGAHAASAIGEACSLRRVMTTALVVSAITAPEEAVSKTLAQLRPWSLMVVIANPAEYIADMLTALRA